MDRQKDRLTDGGTLFYRTLPVKARGPKKGKTKIQKNKESFLDEKKNIFIDFEGLSLGEK